MGLFGQPFSGLISAVSVAFLATALTFPNLAQDKHLVLACPRK